MSHTVNIKELTDQAIQTGDTAIYYQLSLDFMDSPYPGFLHTALIMANKYDYHQAYADVYYCLTDLYHKKEFTELDDVDNRTRAIALEYLNEGAKRGSKECKRILEHYIVQGKYILEKEE
jgi:hypothetical protein